MRYTIKCNECGKNSLLETQKYGNVKFRCPHCGNVMSCLLTAPEPFIVKVRSVFPVTGSHDLYGDDGKKLPLVKTEVTKAAKTAVSTTASSKRQGSRDKESSTTYGRVRGFLRWTWAHLSVFFSWSSSRIDKFREKYEDADQWLFVGFSLLFIVSVFLGLFVFAEMTKLIVSGQSWLFKTYLSIIH